MPMKIDEISIADNLPTAPNLNKITKIIESSIVIKEAEIVILKYRFASLLIRHSTWYNNKKLLKKSLKTTNTAKGKNGNSTFAILQYAKNKTKINIDEITPHIINTVIIVSSVNCLLSSGILKYFLT